MPGLYIHIPFCRQACHYCNFHFSTTLNRKDELLEAVIKEIGLQENILSGKNISTVYLGGGTPSLLSAGELMRIFECVGVNFNVTQDAEITLEANPDDLSPEKITELKLTPVNRLSIGVQSFNNEDLRLLNRAHSAQQARQSIRLAQEAGLTNITIDLIYGIPGLSDERWKSNIEKALSFGLPHLSAYSLTVEPKTALHHFVRTGRARPVDEDQSAKQFEILMDSMEQAGYLQYEISNFCKPGMESRHNSSYWTGEEYIGIGPSAHSYLADPREKRYARRWNVSNNAAYIRSVMEGTVSYEEEQLTVHDRYNEYLLTSLRTMKGADLDYAGKEFGGVLQKELTEAVQDNVRDGLMMLSGKHATLTRSGKLLADRIIANLFVIPQNPAAGR